MRIVLAIMAAVLCGCGHAERAKPVDLGITLAPVVITDPPVVKFHVMYLREYGDFYVVSSDDLDLTLQDALKMGLPAELWVYFAICGSADERYAIYFVKPVRI